MGSIVKTLSFFKEKIMRFDIFVALICSSLISAMLGWAVGWNPVVCGLVALIITSILGAAYFYNEVWKFLKDFHRYLDIPWEQVIEKSFLILSVLVCLGSLFLIPALCYVLAGVGISNLGDFLGFIASTFVMLLMGMFSLTSSDETPNDDYVKTWKFPLSHHLLMRFSRWWMSTSLYQTKNKFLPSRKQTLITSAWAPCFTVAWGIVSFLVTVLDIVLTAILSLAQERTSRILGTTLGCAGGAAIASIVDETSPILFVVIGGTVGGMCGKYLYTFRGYLESLPIPVASLEEM